MNKTIKNSLPINLLVELLDKITIYDEKNMYYILNNESYKKGNLQHLITNFIDSIKPYYVPSKLHYLERNITFKSFLTIIRQICKSKDILYNIKMNYVKSKYELIYYIYIKKPINNNINDKVNNHNDISNNAL